MIVTTDFSLEFDRLSDYLLTFAYKLTRDKVAAQDLYQETALRAFDNQEKFVPQTNLKAWLSTIMKNTFINDFRKTKRQRENILKTGENPIVHHSVKRSSNEGETGILAAELEQLVEDLEHGLKYPFMQVFKGYKYDEVSEMMVLPLGTVKSRVFIARRKLRERIRQVYGQQDIIGMLN